MTWTHVNFGDACIRVGGYYRPAQPGRNYLANGDPGYPPEPAEFEATCAFYEGADITPILDELLQRNLVTEAMLLENIEEEDYEP